jgi:hypothetical protein
MMKLSVTRNSRCQQVVQGGRTSKEKNMRLINKLILETRVELHVKIVSRRNNNGADDSNFRL